MSDGYFCARFALVPDAEVALTVLPSQRTPLEELAPIIVAALQAGEAVRVVSASRAARDRAIRLMRALVSQAAGTA